MLSYFRITKLSSQSSLLFSLRNASNLRKPGQPSIQFKLGSKVTNRQNKAKQMLESLASNEGKTHFSVTVCASLCGAVLVWELSKSTIFSNHAAKLYLHEEMLKDESYVVEVDTTPYTTSNSIWHHLDEHSQSLLNQVVHDMKLAESLLPKLIVFYTDKLGVRGYHISNLKGFKSGYMGVPFYCSFHDTSQVNLEELRHKMSTLPFMKLNLAEIAENSKAEPKDIEELKETFVMSDNAKKFMLASNAYEFASSLVYPIKSSSLIFLISCHYFITANINEFLGMFRRPLHVRLGVYSMVFPVAILVSSAVVQLLRRLLDESVDTYSCNLGAEYAKGGIEFYDKAIKRASLIRKLHSKGVDFFEEDGSEITLTQALQSQCSLENRKIHCENGLETLIRGEKLPLSTFQTLLYYEFS